MLAAWRKRGIPHPSFPVEPDVLSSQEGRGCAWNKKTPCSTTRGTVDTDVVVCSSAIHAHLRGSLPHKWWGGGGVAPAISHSLSHTKSSYDQGRVRAMSVLFGPLNEDSSMPRTAKKLDRGIRVQTAGGMNGCLGILDLVLRVRKSKSGRQRSASTGTSAVRLALAKQQKRRRCEDQR